MSVQNPAFNTEPSQFCDKEAWLNIIISAYNFLSASTTLAQALDNKYSNSCQLTESTSIQEVPTQPDECPFFINMITESTPTKISLHTVEDEKLDVDISPDKDLNNVLLENNEGIDEELELPDIIPNKALDHDLEPVECVPNYFVEYTLQSPEMSLNNYLNHELFFPEIVLNNLPDNKLEISDISSNLQLQEISPNEIVDEKLDEADISLNKILNYEFMCTNCNLITEDIRDTECLNSKDTSNVHNNVEEEIPCSETSPIITTPECLNIDSIINTALNTLCLLEAAILDIEHSEETPRLLSLINNQNANKILTTSDDLTDLESNTNTYSQSVSTINSAAMDTLDTTTDTTIDTTNDTNLENIDNNNKSNIALPIVGSDRMLEVDIDLQKAINNTTESKSKGDSKEGMNESQPTVNRRFEGTLKAQIFKQPEIQRELLEYSREQNPQKTINFPASIQKLKTQLDKISEEGKKADQTKLYNHIVHISDMVTQLEYEHEEHLKNNPILRKHITKKNLPTKKNSQPSSPMKKIQSDPPIELPKKNEIKTEEATKTNIDNKVKKNKIHPLKKRQAVIKPVPNLKMMEGILNEKFVNTLDDTIEQRNLKGYNINLTNLEAIIPKSKKKKNARNKHALDEIFPKIEVVTSIANQRSSKYAEHVFEFRPTSSSEGRGRINLNQRMKKHIHNI